MDFSFFSKIQVINHLSNSLDHPERPIIMWLKFLSTSLFESGLAVRLQHQIYHITYLKILLSPLLINILLMLILSLTNIILKSLIMSWLSYNKSLALGTLLSDSNQSMELGASYPYYSMNGDIWIDMG